ncbi:DUF417 family protein [Sphingobacterium sp. NPDC055346]
MKKTIIQSIPIGTFSNVLGAIEVTTGLLISLLTLSPKLSATGSVSAVLTLLITVTLIVSTPGVIQEERSFPFLSGSLNEFLIKDLVRSGALLWTAWETLAVTHNQRPDNSLIIGNIVPTYNKN